MSKFKDFFMRISFAARISQFENDKTDIRKRFQQNVATKCTYTCALRVPNHLLNVMCNPVL